MKKQNGSKRHELRREYDPEIFRRGVRGKYYQRAMAGTNLVLIEPEIAEVFPTGEAVNDALRHLIKVANSHARPGRKGIRRRLPRLKRTSSKNQIRG